ncbi:hypothetical protein G7Y89_g7753 [Cudoniella acicularis]|uniref:RING-type domain-containing protein n=1 Tax=Cudoniella acicularis TaxID=354080 RepID=A0A8H4W1N6_9HELO|nr:hypothetical protein G7Y89_g7753 [Cudoniella acicularis]
MRMSKESFSEGKLSQHVSSAFISIVTYPFIQKTIISFTIQQHTKPGRQEAMASSYWDPKEVLDVDPMGSGHTCTGKTIKGDQCTNTVNRPDRNQAVRIITRLARVNILEKGLTESVKTKIHDLAEKTLCVRNHREQADDVAASWCEEIEDYIVGQRRISRQGAELATARRAEAAPRPVNDHEVDRQHQVLIPQVPVQRVVTPFQPQPRPQLHEARVTRARAAEQRIREQPVARVERIPSPQPEPIRNLQHPRVEQPAPMNQQQPAAPHHQADIRNMSIHELEDHLQRQAFQRVRLERVREEAYQRQVEQERERRLANERDDVILRLANEREQRERQDQRAMEQERERQRQLQNQQRDEGFAALQDLQPVLGTDRRRPRNNMNHGNRDAEELAAAPAPVYAAQNQQRLRPVVLLEPALPAHIARPLAVAAAADAWDNLAAEAGGPAPADIFLNPVRRELRGEDDDMVPPRIPNFARRKPLTEPCYVCIDPFNQDDIDDESAIVFCNECGQNLHKRCFETWSEGKLPRDVTCGFCRAKWYP